MGGASGQEFKFFPDQWTQQAVMEHIIIHYRWVFVMFLLPISLCYDIYSAARSYIVFKLNSAPSKHVEKVKHVQKQVRKWKDQGSKQPISMNKSIRQMYPSEGQIDTSPPAPKYNPEERRCNIYVI